MSARDDYPAGDLMSGWASVYDQLWTEIDHLRADAILYSREGWASRNEAALNVALEYGWVDGDHHKLWVIDQMVRALTGDSYEHMVGDNAEWLSEGTPP